jgi:hypothetical protein
MSELGDASREYAKAIARLDKLLALEASEVSLGMSAFVSHSDKNKYEVEELVLARLREFFPQVIKEIADQLRQEVAQARAQLVAIEARTQSKPTLVKDND